MGIRTVLQGGVNRISGKGFRVDITGLGVRRFPRLDEFGEFLEQCRQPNSTVIRGFSRMNQARIEREIARTEALYRGLLETMIQCAEGLRPLDALWRELDISLVPDEAHWPSILFACTFNEASPPGWRERALSAFLEYLRARKRSLLAFRAARFTDDPAETNELEFLGLNLDLEVANAWLAKDLERIETITRAVMTRERRYRRIPYDLPISVTLADQASIGVYLARWKIVLRRHDRELCLQQDSEEFHLRPGKNMVGRAPDCDVVLLRAPLDVSRKHLVVDWRGKGELIIRDVSMKGSWLPRNALSTVDP